MLISSLSLINIKKRDREVFIENKFKKWYFKIINSAENRLKVEGCELHHIVPRCMNGNNDKINLVYLTHREHYICHLLLCKMVIETNILKKLINAAFLMQNTRVRNARQYEFIKMHIHRRGKDNWFYGKKHTESSKKKISNSLKGRMVGKNNPMFGRTGATNPDARPVIINGIEYDTIKSAALHLNIHRDTIVYRIKTNIDGTYRYKFNRKERFNPAIAKIKKKVSIEGKIYPSSTEAANDLNMLPETLRYRISSKNFPNWFYIID